LNGDAHKGELVSDVVVFPETVMKLTPYEEDILKDSVQIEFKDTSNAQALGLEILAVLDPGVTVDQKGIEAYLFQTDKGYVVNLLNATYDVLNDDLTPFEEIQVTLRVPDRRDVSEVVLASPDTLQETNLQFEQNGSTITFTIPSLWIWNMIFVR
jgi:hypothetical protein